MSAKVTKADIANNPIDMVTQGTGLTKDAARQQHLRRRLTLSANVLYAGRIIT